MQHASLDLVFVASRTFPFLIVLTLASVLTIMIAERLRHSEIKLETTARAALLEQQRLQSVVDAAGVGMMLVSPQIKIRWFSKRSREWFHWSHRNVDATCPLLSGDGRCASCIAEETALTGQPREAERAIRSAGGVLQHFRHATSPVRDRKGNIIQVVELVEDITARKSLEAEALHKSRLSVLGRMAAGIAHEIGNPLSSLTTRIHLMEHDTTPAFVRESVALLRDQIDRIDRIVRAVSQFARSRSVAWTVWDVTAAVEETVRIVQLDRRAQRIQIELLAPSPSPHVRGVRDQISQVFLNLLLNAVESIDHEGRVTAEIRQDAHQAHVTIRDTGRGMDEAVRDRLFEPFFSTKPSGTGLGLSISYTLVHAHGGRIRVESSAGSGSAFTVSLPLASKEPEKATRERDR